MLILCEKPSVAKDFARALDCSFKGGCYQNNAITITNCVGHLFELCPPEAYNPAYQKWDMIDLPIIPEQFKYKQIEALKKQTALVLSLVKKHRDDEILIATDAGREGELIAREVLLMAGIRDVSRCRRFWVSEALTEPVIRAGVADAKPLSAYNKTARQGFARARADWLVGMNLTRRVSIGNSATFHVGRVQSAVLNAVLSRNEDVARFVPVPYQELEARVLSVTGNALKALLVNPKTRKTAFPPDDPYIAGAKAYCEGRRVERADVKAARKVQKPERLPNITGLQKAAYKKFGYAPERTLEIAQSLYENHKCLSYPRTPSRVMGDNNVELFRAKFEMLKDTFPRWARFSDSALITPSNKRIFNSAALEDHHALIPLGRLPSGVSEEERNVYEIVARSFFTACMPDYIYNEKIFLFYCGEYVFSASVRETIQNGWRASLEKEERDAGAECEMGVFDEKDCVITKLEVLNKKTEPPKEFSTDTLLGFMENPRNAEGERLVGLGTPATRAEVIKRLFSRGYIEEKGKKLRATDKGAYLIRLLRADARLAKIADTGQTTEWERRLESDPAAFEAEIAEYIRLSVKGGAAVAAFEESAIGKCPVCGRNIAESAKSFYCPGYKDADKPCRFAIWKETRGAKMSLADAQALLTGKKTGVKKFKSKEGGTFSARLYLDKDGKVSFAFVDRRK
jgi:DNA topoisomerase-3